MDLFKLRFCPTSTGHPQAQASRSESAGQLWLQISREDTVAASTDGLLGQRTSSHAHPGSVGPSHRLAVHRGLRATLTGLPYRTTGNRAAGFTPHPVIQERAGDHDGSHSVLDTSLRIGHCHSAGVCCSCSPTRTPTLHKPGAPTRDGAHRGQSKSLASTLTDHFADSFITI